MGRTTPFSLLTLPRVMFAPFGKDAPSSKASDICRSTAGSEPGFPAIPALRPRACPPIVHALRRRDCGASNASVPQEINPVFTAGEIAMGDPRLQESLD